MKCFLKISFFSSYLFLFSHKFLEFMQGVVAILID